jgi:hypothetical protein
VNRVRATESAFSPFLLGMTEFATWVSPS